MEIASPNFRDADEKKGYVLALKKLFKDRFPASQQPQVHGKQLLFYDILTELNAASTDFGLLLVYDAIIPFLARQGLIQPLDKAFPDAERRFLPAALRRGQVDGKLYAVPLHVSARMLFYRKDLLEKHGFKPPKTWAELEEIGLAIVEKEKKPRFRALGLQFASYAQFAQLLDHLWASGHDLYQHPTHWDFNQGAVASVLRRLHKLVWDPRLAGPASLDSAYWDPLNDFLEGRCAFPHHYTDVLKLAHERGGDLAKNIGWMPLPGQGSGTHVMRWAAPPTWCLRAPASRSRPWNPCR